MNLRDARISFRDAPVTHVASICPDGSPHVVPLWFVWLDEDVFVSCREGSRVWRNLSRDPRVVLEFDRGRSWTEHAGALIHAKAEFLRPDDASAKRAISAWFGKYTRELGGDNFAAYAEQVRRPVLFRARPDRIATWSHGRFV